MDAARMGWELRQADTDDRKVYKIRGRIQRVKIVERDP